MAELRGRDKGERSHISTGRVYTGGGINELCSGSCASNMKIVDVVVVVVVVVCFIQLGFRGFRSSSSPSGRPKARARTDRRGGGTEKFRG